MASNSINPEVVEDCFGMLKLYSDGSVFRNPDIKPRNPYVHDDGSAVWKDCLFDATHDLYLRLYKPKTHSFSGDKLPVVCYFRAGGFCFGSRTNPNPHNSCLSLCAAIRAVVVSPDYRLAPENRLPAALVDGRAALRWLRDQAVVPENRDEWLSDGVDFDRVFVFGDSSGGNIGHHLAVEFEQGSPEMLPVRIKGYILLSPFFGGTKRTRSEEESPCEEFWTQEIYDRLVPKGLDFKKPTKNLYIRFWRLAVPIGSDADHPMVNPFGPASPSLAAVSLDPILVLVGGDEILRDRIEEYATRLRELNKKIKYVEFEGKQHGFFTSNSYTEEAKDVIRVIKDFISEHS